MSISIIIPTYNPGAAAVSAMCDALAQQKTPFSELVIIDSSSNDGTAELWRSRWWQAAEQYQHHAAFVQKTIPKSSFNHGATRNVAAQLASGEVLVFLTQDALPQDSHWLGALTDALTHASESAIVGAFARQIAPEDAPAKERFARAFNYPEKARVKHWSDVSELGIKTFFFSNVSAAFQRSAFEDVGGFPETILNEDMLITVKLLRAGYAVKYAASARVWHGHDYGILEQFKRYFDIGVSLARAKNMPARLGSSGEGWRFVRAQLAFVRAEEGWLALPGVLAEASAKWWGFQLGKRERWLPLALKLRLSMHRGFWEAPDMPLQNMPPHTFQSISDGAQPASEPHENAD